MVEGTFIRLLAGDCREVLETLRPRSVHCAVTSPPYWLLRDYGPANQIGLEETVEEYIAALVEACRGIRRALRDDGTLWLVLGDTYVRRPSRRKLAGGFDERPSEERVKAERAMTLAPRGRSLKPKDLVGIPWRAALALQRDGWYLRQDIVWSKPNPMPESVTDRCTKSHEYVFLLSKEPSYYFDAEAIREPSVAPGSVHVHRSGTKNTGVASDPRFATRPQHAIVAAEWRNRRSVWAIPTSRFAGAHFAVFPPELIRPCIRAGSPRGGVVLDPFMGSGTTGVVAREEGRSFIGIDLNPGYLELARERIGEATERRLHEGGSNAEALPRAKA